MAKRREEKRHEHPQHRTAKLPTKYFRATPPSELTLDEFSMKEAPANTDAYFSFRSPPNDWALFIQNHPEISKPHLFAHTLALILDDDVLAKRNIGMAKVYAMSDDKEQPKAVRNLLTSWLSDRPAFSAIRVSRHRRFFQWNAWDKATHADMVNTATDTGVPAAQLFIVYSTKSLATSYLSPHLDELLEKVVSEWDRWLGQENKDLEELLATITH